MGLLRTFRDLSRSAGRLGLSAATGPLVATLEGSLRQLVDEAVDARAVVHGSELAAVAARAQGVRDEATRLSGGLAGIVQAADAHLDDDDLGEALGLGDLPSAVSRLETHRGDLARRADRLLGALDVAAAQIEAAAGRLAALARP